MARLTPLEIQRSTFPRRLNGYDPEVVRELLSRVAEQVEDDARERGEVRAQMAKLTRELEDARQRAGAADATRVAAERTAEATVARAEAEAERIVTEAQTLADRLLDEASRRAEMVEVLIAQLRQQRRSARADLKRVAELLEGLADEDERAEEREGESNRVALLRPRTREGQR
jgi:DivIVA domain-containing protein